MHHEHTHEDGDHYDHGKRMKQVGQFSNWFGKGQILTGLLSGNLTTLMAGIHNYGDGKIHNYRGDAARLESKKQQSHARHKLRRAALGMLGISALTVGAEQLLEPGNESPPVAIQVVAGVDIAFNALSLAYLVTEKRKTHALKASILHAFVDTGGMVATGVGVFGQNPTYGVLGHAAAIAVIAGTELYSSQTGSTLTAATPPLESDEN